MVLLSGLLGALIGASITLVFNMWKFHRDELTSRCDELCRAIWDASVHAADYWATDFNKTGSRQALAEARLLALQTHIDGIFGDFRPFLSEANEIEIDAQLSDLLDVLTGGLYSVPCRKIDLARATRAAPLAGDLSVKIRRAHRESMPFYKLRLSFHENKRRKLDMPLGWEQQ